MSRQPQLSARHLGLLISTFLCQLTVTKVWFRRQILRFVCAHADSVCLLLLRTSLLVLSPLGDGL